MKLLTAAQMRSLEQAAITAGDVTGLTLMERAGQGVVSAILRHWPDLVDEDGQGGAAPHSAGPNTPRDISGTKKHKAVVLCGPGNNGGDGFVVARLLFERGWDVEVLFYGQAEKLPPDAKANFEVWTALGMVEPLVAGALKARAQSGGAEPVFVDALFGIGLTRGFSEDLARIAVEWDDHCGKRRVAVDVQSGICADSGACLGEVWFPANLVVTFEFAKRGHFLSDPQVDVAALSVAPLGIADHLQAEAVDLVNTPPLGGKLRKTSDHNKFSNGHALIMSGPPGKGGAARLAARGALRVGAGVVTVGCPMRAVFEHSAQLNAIMVRGLDGTHGLDEMLEDTRITALCLGPGLGLSATTADLVKRALAACRGTVLDADALSRFQRKPDILFDMLHDNCVVTPHGGEFARLFPDLAQAMAADPSTEQFMSKIAATQEAAKRAGCVVLFKGADTVIASPDGRCSVHAALYDRSAPWLATAGSGDVLAGIITGLLARGYDAKLAAETGAWLHVEAARCFGPGLIAEDLPEQLPNVFRSLSL